MNSGFVEVWAGDILSDEHLLKAVDEQPYWSLLNQAEQQKALTYSKPVLQKKYIKTRGILKRILGGYLEVSAADIRIDIAAHGKPYLLGHPVYFNLSHTDNRWVLAVTNVSEIGIDLEHYKERKNLSGLVSKCFSVTERDYWLLLTETEKIRLFYQLWVRKEAFVKATGRGIVLGLEQCIVDVDDLNHFISIPEHCGQAGDWDIQPVVLNVNDVCVLVIHSKKCAYTLRSLAELER